MTFARKRIFRFAIVGFLNATISFGVLNFSYYVLHQNKIVSGLIATSCALIFSFAMNRIFVFVDRSRKATQQFLPFALVTISGSLIVINIIYILMLQLLNGHEQYMIDIVKHATSITVSKSFLDINLSTIVGAAVAMIWNYNGYRIFVFRGSRPASYEQDVN